mmetsp:Transcript_51599/g.117463  ORF Transcript_51599/g.117463 Transcript_51599/m.117463 type:complete len:765 (+) Transcript_51599:173-2467(+)
MGGKSSAVAGAFLLVAGYIAGFSTHGSTLLTRCSRGPGYQRHSLVGYRRPLRASLASADFQDPRRRTVSLVGWNLPKAQKSPLRQFTQSSKEFLSRNRAKPPEEETGAASVVGNQEWKSLGELALADKGLLVVSSISLVAAALCEVAIPRFVSGALAGVMTADQTGFTAAMQGLFAFYLGSAVFTGLRGGLFWLAGARVVARLRLRLFSSLLKREIDFFDRTSTGELTSRLGADAAKLSNVVSFHVNIIVRQAVMAAGGTAYLFWLNAKVATAAMGGLVFMALVSHVNGAFSRWMSVKVQDRLAEANDVAEQALSLVRLVRAHAAEDREAERYSAKLATILTLQETQGIAYGLSRVLAALAGAAVTGSVLLAGWEAVASGAMTGADLTTFIFYVNFVSAASFDVGEQWTRIQEALGAGSKIFAYCKLDAATSEATAGSGAAAKRDRPEAAAAEESEAAARAEEAATEEAAKAAAGAAGPGPEEGSAQPVPSSSSSSAAAAAEVEVGLVAGPAPRAAKLSMEGVHFEYPSRAGAPVLRGLNLEVGKGEVIGLVGGSGGGKSTVLRLLCGFYQPDRGRVLLDGCEVSGLGPKELARRISWVTQEPQLFPISIEENIAYGLEPGSWGASDIERCARLANAHAFVAALPRGYQTVVGAGGGSLSGGQRQRVAIARALMRDPEVLLLDEPTSALDADSEALVTMALRNAFVGRTVVVVAHRLATVQRSDRIVVLERGTVAEEGRPLELAERKDGAYARLLRRQAEALPA